MGKQMAVDKDALTPIANQFRNVLEIPSEYQFPLSEFPNMIESALGKTAGENYQLGYDDGKSQGFDEAYWQGYGDGTNNGIEIGKEQGYSEGTENGIEIGKQISYDEFWDGYQLGSSGNPKSSHQYAFASNCWNDNTFFPKYDLILSAGYTGTYMFWSNAVSNLKQRLAECGVTLDTSQCGYSANMFQSARTTELPIIDLSNATLGTQYCFASSYIETIDKVVFSENTSIVSTTFSGASGLRNVVFDGVIAKNINLQWSTNLSHDSIVSAVNTLSATATGQTLTLSKTAVNKAFETSTGANDGSASTEWATLVATKTNWTISLV